MARFERIGKEITTSLVLNYDPESRHEEMTVPIAGVPRGGTTMVAAAVDALGIDLGPLEDLKNFHFEDQTMHSPDLNVQYRYIKKRDQEHKVWGWKDPVSVKSLERVLFALRNPHVILVFRDVLATIQGEMRFDEAYGIIPSRTFENLLEITRGWWDTNFAFINRIQLPTMLVSYERAIANPRLFVQELVSFLSPESVPGQQAKAISRISREGGYLILE